MGYGEIQFEVKGCLWISLLYVTASIFLLVTRDFLNLLALIVNEINELFRYLFNKFSETSRISLKSSLPYKY